MAFLPLYYSEELETGLSHNPQYLETKIITQGVEGKHSWPSGSGYKETDSDSNQFSRFAEEG